MPVRHASKFAQVLSRTTFWLGVVIVAVATVVMLGWIAHLDVLLRLIAGGATTKFNTALCFALAGASLILAHPRPSAATPPRFAAPVAVAACSALLLIALLTLGQYVFGWDAGIDQLLFRAPITDSALPGRMSAATAAGFVVLGTALLLQMRGRVSIVVGQALAALSLSGALFDLLVYLFGANIERVTPFSSLALPTAINFLAASVGALLLRGTSGWVAVFFQDTISARIGRRYLLFMLVALPILAGLCVIGQRTLHWYGPYFGAALLTAASMAVLGLSIWISTREGNVADRKISNLARVNATISGINSLIVRVGDQDELFRESCRIAGEVGKFPWVWIAMSPPEGAEGPVLLQASRGARETRVAGLQHVLTEQQVLADVVSHLQRTGAPLVIGDLGREANATAVGTAHYRQLLAGGICSLVAMPLTVEGEVVGAFVLTAEMPEFFDDAEMRLLREMAGDISFAINHIWKEKRLNYLAYYDPLTGLPNRVFLLERLSRELKQAERDSRQVVLSMLNLRRFRAVNESMGRQAGDELLRQVAERLQRELQFPENLSRLGADSFATFVTGREAGQLAVQIMELRRRVMSEPFVIEGHGLTMAANIGLSVFPQDAGDGETLMLHAESALRQAQASGELMMFYEPRMNARAVDLLRMESKLHRALDNEEFVLHYQPKVDFGRREVHEVEALMRWDDPEMGPVPPGRFIPVMEDMGLIERAGAWALMRAVADTGRWRAMGRKPPRVAVNVSAIQLRSEGFLHDVEKALAAFAGGPPLLDIEVTESILMADVGRASKLLQRIRDMQVNIAVDDFGTGYSSLAYLAQLPINALKIDRSFVMAIDEAGPGRVIVASTISLAHSLGLVVVAEGVETQSQADHLRSLGCDLMQGYLFSRPVPFDELVALLPNA